MSVSSYEARSGAPLRAKAARVPTAREAAGRVLGVLAGAERPGSPYQALHRLGGDWLRRQRLAALAWWRWRGSSDCPLGVALDLQTAWYVAVGDAELHRLELGRVLQTLAAQGITPVVFKGAVLAHTAYPDPACRQMSDIDLWLTDEEMLRAQAALEAIGYGYVSKPERPRAIMLIDTGEIQLHGSTKDTGLIELHWGVFAGEWLRLVASVDAGAIRSRVTAIRLLGQAVLALAPEDAVIQVAVHAAVNHQLSLAALRSLVDVALLARTQPMDWRIVADRARAWRVATATWLVLSLAVDLCGLDEAAEAARQLAPSRQRQKLIGLFANAESLVDMRDLSASKWRYVYLLLLVDRGREVAKLIYRTLWPEREWLVARYGRSGFSVRLRHLVNATRGKI